MLVLTNYTDVVSKDQRLKIKDQGSMVMDLVRSRIEHPRRDTDVILRQSKALLEIFNSR